MAAKKSSNEIKITRIYDAPLKIVWDAWHDPKQVAQWWGPRGFTLTTHSKDLRTGGNWNYTMHGPDGVDYPNITQYLEVVQYSRLVYDHGGSSDRPPLFRVTANFSEIKSKTKLEMTMTLPTPEAAEEIRKFIKKAGGDSTWDRLAEYLEKGSSGKENFVINRSFPVSLEKMFELWTNPKHFSQWLPPKGANMEFIRAEIRPGGEIFYKMITDQEMVMYGKVHYLEITAPDHLLYTQEFCDEHGKVSRHPMAPTWPETMLTKVKLSAETVDQTRVTITWEPYGKFTQQEVDTFVQAKAGMTQGWTGSFDKLEAYLEK